MIEVINSEENIIQSIYSRTIKQNISYEKAMANTRNLSVFIVAGMMYFIFGFPQTSSHLIAIIGSLTVFLLQIFESRELAKNFAAEKKLKMIETSFANEERGETAKRRIKSLLLVKPESFHYSFAATTYKSYILIFLTLDVCWFSKLYLFPEPASTFHEFLNRPAFGFLPGWFFFLFAASFWIIYFSLAIWYKIKSSKMKDEE